MLEEVLTFISDLRECRKCLCVPSNARNFSVTSLSCGLYCQSEKGFCIVSFSVSLFHSFLSSSFSPSLSPSFPFFLSPLFLFFFLPLCVFLCLSCLCSLSWVVLGRIDVGTTTGFFFVQKDTLLFLFSFFFCLLTAVSMWKPRMERQS